jgi:hypothetical protein
MQEGEGVAIHTGPESCGATRKGGVEALTAETAGQEIEPRKHPRLRDADARTNPAYGFKVDGACRHRQDLTANSH